MDDDLGDEVSGFKDGVSRFFRDGILVEAGDVEAAPSPVAEPAGLSSAKRERYRQLVAEERAISTQRRRLHDRIDFIRSQGVTTETEAILDHLIEKEQAASRTKALTPADRQQVGEGAKRTRKKAGAASTSSCARRRYRRVGAT
jgi:hypothetical protein